MLGVALKDFEFSRNGVDIEKAEAQSTVDFPDALVPGLEAEGFIKPATDQQTSILAAPENKDAGASTGTKVVVDRLEIPQDWRNLHYRSIISLAERISAAALGIDKNALNEATGIIEAEVSRRQVSA